MDSETSLFKSYSLLENNADEKMKIISTPATELKLYRFLSFHFVTFEFGSRCGRIFRSRRKVSSVVGRLLLSITSLDTILKKL